MYTVHILLSRVTMFDILDVNLNTWRMLSESEVPSLAYIPPETNSEFEICTRFQYDHCAGKFKMQMWTAV